MEKSDALVNYKKARKALRSSIKSAKREHFEGLLEDLDRNPWGTAYKMLSKKSPIAPMTEEESITQATLLFPVHERVSWHREPTAVQHPFTMAELSDCVEKIACKKASGPDEIPPEIIKAMITGAKEDSLRVFNLLMAQQRFPKSWKSAELLLKPKPASTKFCPICLINSLSKVYERLIVNRLQEAVHISDN